MLRLLLVLASCLCFLAATRMAVGGDPEPIHVVYFVPKGMEPRPDYEERIDRAMTDIQSFFREEMQRNGYGPLTFALDKDAQGKLIIHRVDGEHPPEFYDRDKSSAVLGETKAALRERGVDINGRVLLMLSPLIQWRQDGTSVHYGPYRGGPGWACAYDDVRLDPRLLSSKRPGGHVPSENRFCTIGEFNSRHLGGIAHELAHGFGLGHVAQTHQQLMNNQRALMGYGNRNYRFHAHSPGKRTAILTRSSAMQLSQNRSFAGESAGANVRPMFVFKDVTPRYQNGVLRFSGKVEAEPSVFGISIAVDDPAKEGDYDAVGWSANVAQSGMFTVDVRELSPGPKYFRMTICHEGGAVSAVTLQAEIDRQGRPNVSSLADDLLLGQAVESYRRRDNEQAFAIARELHESSDNPLMKQKAVHLANLLKNNTPVSPASIKPDTKSFPLSCLPWKEASVGWGRPLRNQVFLNSNDSKPCFLEVGGRFFQYGLYGHAPSSYTFEIDPSWKRLTFSYGRQMQHSGAVVFVIKSNDRELFRSSQIDDDTLRSGGVSLVGVSELTLIVESGDDGHREDWGVWLNPRLER